VKPFKIAMVCTGNICRSPMAEAVATEMLIQAAMSEFVTVESFGTTGYHVGESAAPPAVAALRRRGWPTRPHRARVMRPKNLAEMDLVLCADRENLAELTQMERAVADSGKVWLLRSFDPTAKPGDDEVPDPYGRPDFAFDASLTLIERSCRGMVAKLEEARAAQLGRPASV
jgi:protein-tyrosine phosphatase